MCTTFSLKTNEGFVGARTMESPTPGSYEHFMTLVLPRGFCVNNVQNQKVPNKYAILGSCHYGDYALCDGLNEHGLCGSVNLFANLSKYPKKIGKNLSFAPENIFPFILGNAKNCVEAKKLLEEIEMLEIPFGGVKSVLNLHIALFDPEGGFLVIEPENEVLKVYESKIRIMTNSPDFNWHIKNLANYIQLSPSNKKDSIFEGSFAFGQGSGSIGLPGDFTPASRFIRAAFFVSASPIFNESVEGVKQALRILHQFDIPFGAVKEKEALEITQYSAIMDGTKLRYYLNYYKEFEVLSFDLVKYLEVQEPVILKKMS